MARSEINWYNTLADNKKKSAVWDTEQQKYFIGLLESVQSFVVDRGCESIWATIVLRQAYDVADWITEKGYSSCEACEYEEMWVPYDASTWRGWIKKELGWYEHEGGDISITNDHIKAVALLMVRRKYIRIPLNSGLPLYSWLLNGYGMHDFCNIYQCIEYIYHGKFHVHEIEHCLRHHMDHIIRAKTGFRLIYVMWVTGTGEEFEDKHTAKVLEKVYFMYRDRKESSAATKIQSLFRVFTSKKMVGILRAHPDHLFHPEYSKARKVLLRIDDTCFFRGQASGNKRKK